MSTEPQVIVVVSSEFFPKLDELALSSHVWAVRTAPTEEAARRIWENDPPQEAHTLTSGLTLFKGEGDPADDLLSVLDEIDLHHGSSGVTSHQWAPSRCLAPGRQMPSVRRSARSASPVLYRIQTGSSPIALRMRGSAQETQLSLALRS